MRQYRLGHAEKAALLLLAATTLLFIAPSPSNAAVSKKTGTPNWQPTPLNYTPTGPLVIDTGFRPTLNGFSFPNYINSSNRRNLTTSGMKDLFGKRVCLGGKNKNCRLNPIANKWMRNQNSEMADGHCMGMSVTALRFYGGLLKTANFGGATTAQIPFHGNLKIQGMIAEDWVYQDIPRLERLTTTYGDANSAFTAISTRLAANQDLWTLGIYQDHEGTGGHAITPFAIESLGNNVYNLLVYDNNWAGDIRAIGFDLNANTWSYQAGYDASETDALYQFGGNYQGFMDLTPTLAGEKRPIACRMCTGSVSARKLLSPVMRKAEISAHKMVDITLSSQHKSNHAHLVFTDAQGRKTGIVNDQLLQQIPGIIVELKKIGRRKKNGTNKNSATWGTRPEPIYAVPLGMPLTITVDGTELKVRDTETLNIIGSGLYDSVEGMVLYPGDQQTVTFDGAAGFGYATDAKRSSAPMLAGGVERKGAFYGFAFTTVAGVGTKDLDLAIDNKAGIITAKTKGTKATVGKGLDYAYYPLAIDRETQNTNTSWDIGALAMQPGEQATVNYGAAKPGKKLRIVIRKPGSKNYRVRWATPSK